MKYGTSNDTMDNESNLRMESMIILVLTRANANWVEHNYNFKYRNQRIENPEQTTKTKVSHHHNVGKSAAAVKNIAKCAHPC
jgi:hypothetical protein